MVTSEGSNVVRPLARTAEQGTTAAPSREQKCFRWFPASFAKVVRACALLLSFLLCSAITEAFAQTGDPIPPKAYTMTPTGVNVADGSFTYKVTDLTIGTLSLERYASGGPSIVYDPDDMPYGKHTGNNFDIFVDPTFSKANQPYFPQHAKPIVHMGMAVSGMYSQYQYTGSVSDIAADSGDALGGQLALQNSAYVYTDNTGAIYTFDPSLQVSGVMGAGVYGTYSQRIANIKFPDGRVRTFSYVSGELKMVSDSSGYAIIFDYTDYYDSAIGRTRHLISDACGFNLSQTYVTTNSTCAGAALKVSYGYTSGLLTSVTDVTNQTTTYQYSGSNPRISCVRPPPGTVCQVANNYPNSYSLVQTLADGTVWQFNWGVQLALMSDEAPPSDGNNTASLTNPAGASSFTFTGTSPYTATDPNGYTTSYVYSGGQDWETVNPPSLHFGSTLNAETLPDGISYVFDNSGPFNAPRSITVKPKPGSGLADEVTQYTYGDINNGATYQNLAKPRTRVDPKGNETDWQYASWGGTLSEMDPAPTAGAARPLKLYTYVQKYAYIKNSGGSLVAASAPIWLPASETLCQTVAGSNSPTCDTSAPEEVTTYQYGANGTADNLLLRGKVVTADGVSLRTCYGYDHWANKVSETKPNAGLSSCP